MTARIIAFEVKSRQLIFNIDLRALLSNPSGREEGFLVRGQVSTPYNNTNRTAALCICDFVVPEMACWHHSRLRRAYMTLYARVDLRSIFRFQFAIVYC